MSNINYFYCSSCGKWTQHVKISLRELESYRRNKSEAIAGAILDITGLGEFVSFFSGEHAYKCCECGRCTERDSAGNVI